MEKMQSETLGGKIAEVGKAFDALGVAILEASGFYPIVRKIEEFFGAPDREKILIAEVEALTKMLEAEKTLNAKYQNSGMENVDRLRQYLKNCLYAFAPEITLGPDPISIEDCRTIPDTIDSAVRRLRQRNIATAARATRLLFVIKDIVRNLGLYSAVTVNSDIAEIEKLPNMVAIHIRNLIEDGVLKNDPLEKETEEFCGGDPRSEDLGREEHNNRSGES